MNDNRMKHALNSITRRDVPENTNLWPRIAARLERKSFMTMLRTRPLMAVIIALLILLALTGVAYAIGKSLGYIPGIGLIEQSAALRSLDKPVSMERDGMRMTISKVVASSQSTLVRFEVEWLTPPPTSGDYDYSCQGKPVLGLPDGSLLNFVKTTDKFIVGEPGSGKGYGYVMEFAPIPAIQNDVTLLYPCLVPFAPGPLPRDWKISFHIVPAPEEMVLPVTEYEPTPIGGEGESQPTQSNQTASIHGISISLDKSVDLADGYILIGSMHWSEKDYPANAIRSADYIKVADATGRDISFEPVLGPVGDKPQDEAYRSYWALKVLEKGFVAPLKIRIDSATVNSYAHPYVFQFNPGSNPAPGQSWDIDKNFQVGDIQARILKANLTTINSHDLVFQFDIQAQPNELVDVFINMAVSQCMGGGGSIPTEPYEVIQAYANTCRTDLPAGPLEAQVSGAVIWGPWQVEWTPPETSAAVPTPTPVPLPTHSEACITMDKFKQAVNDKPALPEGFGGRVILFGPYQGNNNVWKTSIVDLDGSNPQVLGDGDGNFSPDGSKVAFSRTLETDQQGIYITDLVSGETTQLPGTGQGDFNPMWSPDGSQISFNRGMGLFELYAINADGTNLRRLTYDRGQEFAVGWMPDGQHLLYTLAGALYQQTDHLVDVQTGKIEYFSNDEFLGMSPDAKYKITAERDPADMDSWVSYFSNMDDSNRCPLVESDTVLQYPIWSTDGEWLLVSLSKLYDSKNTPVFVHLTDCHMIPLPKLNGIVLDWKP